MVVAKGKFSPSPKKTPRLPTHTTVAADIAVLRAWVVRGRRGFPTTAAASCRVRTGTRSCCTGCVVPWGRREPPIQLCPIPSSVSIAKFVSPCSHNSSVTWSFFSRHKYVPFLQPAVLPTIAASPSPRCAAPDGAQTPKPPLLLAALSTAHVFLSLNVVEELVGRRTRHVGCR